MAAPVAVTAAIASAAKWSDRSRRRRGHRTVGDHPDPAVVNRLAAIRGPGQSYSDVILRLARA